MKNFDIHKINVLKVAHHGSEYTTSEEMLERLQPKISLISCGEGNRYGHPHENLIHRLEKVNSNQYITTRHGAISLEYRNNRVKVNTFVQ